MVNELVSGTIQLNVASVFTNSTLSTRGHIYKVNQEHVYYNLTKYIIGLFHYGIAYQIFLYLHVQF